MARQVLVNSIIYDVYIPTDSSGSIRYPGLNASDFSAISIYNGVYSTQTILDGTGVPNTGLSPDVIYVEEVAPSTGIYNLRIYLSNIGFKFIEIDFVSQSTKTQFSYSISPNLYSSYDGVIVD